MKRRVASGREFVADAFIHAVGLVVGVAGAITLMVMVASRGTPFELTAVSVYSSGLLAMLGCSAAYNLARFSSRRELLRRFDHAAIFVMIAGTYTPFTTLRLEGNWAIGLSVTVWSIAALGVALKLTRSGWSEALSIATYLALGWIGIIALQPLLDSLALSTLVLLAIGGLLYTIGVIFHVWEKLHFQNAIWHGFVLAAAGVHYAAVMSAILVIRPHI
ncbi:MAG: hemolysin III family protein [Candidatus Binatus sp.]|uniref:PAQR family membrane homeostasis protein TrhA n=1 Tax=Candidatus Binatus sp. TaxID=2811406 RepID=UPI002728CC09|nr:hemolysin III family protein [Candidatus Binatus sp.]MDO8432498.1 hemolysin III family protein [Candidatus Binatus sp.]